jgi:hypothetical protein
MTLENDITDTMANLPAGATELRIGPNIDGSDSGNVVRIFRPEHFTPNQSSTVKGLSLYAVHELVKALKEEVSICEERIQAQATKLLVAHTFFMKVDSMETEIKKLQKGLDVLHNAYLRPHIKMQRTDLVALHARTPYDPLALVSKRLAKELEDAKRRWQERLLELDNFTGNSEKHTPEESRTLVDRLDTSHGPYHLGYYEASSSECNNATINTVIGVDPAHPGTSQLPSMPTLGTAVAAEALSAIDFDPTTSAPAIQTPTLPSNTGKASCLVMYQTHSNALQGLAEAEEFTTLEANATFADPSLPVMKKTPASKFELMNSTPDIPAPSTASIQNMDAEMAPVAAAAADENVDAVNQPLPPSPSDPCFISALLPWFSETESEDETADRGQQRLLEEKDAEMTVQKTAPAVPQTVRLVLQPLVNSCIRAVARTWESTHERWVAVLLCAVFSVAWMLLTSAWSLD